MAKSRSGQTVIVKLRDGTPASEATELIRSIVRERDIAAVEQLFPGERDAVLGSLFNVTLATAASPTKVITALEHDEHVEYAHKPSTRKPTR